MGGGRRRTVCVVSWEDWCVTLLATPEHGGSCVEVQTPPLSGARVCWGGMTGVAGEAEEVEKPVPLPEP